MQISDLLNFILFDLEESARVEYLQSRKNLQAWRATEIAIQECREVLEKENWQQPLKELRIQAHDDFEKSSADEESIQWFWFNRECTIDAVADRASVILLFLRLPVVISPSREAARHIAELIFQAN